MNEIKNILLSVETFDELTAVLKSPRVIRQAKLFLNENGVSEINPRLFLISFLIYRFPMDILNIEKETSLCLATKLLIENEDITHFKTLVELFIRHFEDWKKRDREELVNQLFFSYHHLTVNILNSPEEAKEYLVECQKELLETALQLGGTELIQQITSYVPVVLDLDQLDQTYDQVFWDLMTEKIEVKDFGLLVELFRELQRILISLYPSRTEFISELIDPELIDQRLKHDAYSQNELKILVLNILKVVEEVQSPVHDEETKEIKNSIFNLSFLEGLRKTVQQLKTVLVEIENLRLRQRID